MKNLTFLILIIFTHIAFSETEKTENKIATDSFIRNYNNNNYSAIFSQFSSSMQDALPHEKLASFLNDLNAEAGEIINRKFTKYNNGSSATYLTEFERGVYTLYISLDEELKINGLFVKPRIVNNLSFKDSNITKEQSQILFNKTKVFPDQTQVALAVIKNGKVDYYGLIKRNNIITRIENSADLFEIGSISKVFTSTLLAGFVVENKLDLNKAINDYLDFPINNQTKISFKQLSNHTAGLPRNPPNLNLNANPSNPFKNYDKDKLIEYLQYEFEAEQSSENKFRYSNLGAGILGYALSKFANASYEEMLQNMIFRKYKMNNTTSLRRNLKNKLVVGLDKDGLETQNFDLSILVGAGAILSNVEDLAKFSMAQFDDSNEELQLTRQKTFEISDRIDIGLGWYVFKNKSVNKWFGHSGGTGGYRASMVLEPVHKNGIIILSNVSAHHSQDTLIDNLCYELMQSLEL